MAQSLVARPVFKLLSNIIALLNPPARPTFASGFEWKMRFYYRSPGLGTQEPQWLTLALIYMSKSLCSHFCYISILKVN